MSKTIDEKVVEMRFDNRQFESNIKETMSTLDKFKQKLNLTGASKGLENINTAANKVNLSGMSGAIDTVHAKFSALEVMGVTALANITNSAVEAGKRMVKALTIDPVSDGWNEYEMTLNAVQTTMAGTGKSAEEVEKQLKKLDEYADKTVYSTSDMLNNLPKFTNAGVELEKATTAMIGIANATALAGGDASKASIAFYNLGQAIGTGYLTRMDYNSINNAGIATMEWKNQMVEAAIAAGTLKKVGEDTYKVGKKTFTLQSLFIDGLQEQWATTDVMMKVFEDYGNETTEIGKKAYSSAQDIKTFTQMMESLKATAGTGWKDTWQIIFGGLYEAKEFWTGLSNFISNIITGMADARNKFLQGALGKGFKGLGKTLKTITDPIKKAVDGVKNVTTALDDLDKMVNRVILGEFGNGKKRLNELTEAGYNYYAIQNKVNEKLGASFRYSDELVNSQNKLNRAQTEGAEVQTKLVGSESERLEQLAKMSEAELEALGLTKEQIEALKELKKYSDMTGLSIKEFMENIDDIDGRWLLINSFKNIGNSLVSIFQSIGKAWRDVFPAMQSEQLFNIIAGFHKLSLTLKNNVEKNAEDLTRTLRGLFSILGFITDIIGGGFKLAFNVIKTVLSAVAKALGITSENILSVTAAIGDAIYNARQWIKENNILAKTIEVIVPIIIDAVKALKDWIDSNEVIQRGIKKVTDVIKSFSDAYNAWLEGLKETDNVPKYIFDGLVNGLKNGASVVIEAIITFAKGLIEAFKAILQIHSPSKVFFAIGGFIVAGLLLGLQNGFSGVFESIKQFGLGCVEAFKSIDFGKLLAAGIGVGLIVIVKNITDTVKGVVNIIDSLTAPLEGFGNLMTGIGTYFYNSGKAKKIEAYAGVIKSIGISIALLAASIFVLSKIDQGTLWATVGAIAALATIIGLLAFAASKMDGIEVVKSLPIISIAITLLLLATTLKKLASIEPSRMLSTIVGLTAVILALGLLIKAIGKNINPKAEKDIDKVGKMIRKISTSLLILAIVVKLVSMLSAEDMLKGIAFMTIFTAFIVALEGVSNLAGKNADKAGKMISKVAWALLIMIGVVKLASMLDGGEIARGLAVITGIGLIFAALTATSYLAGKNANKAGTMMLAMSASMFIAVGAIRLIASISPDELARGLAAITAIGIIFSALVAVSYFAGKNAVRAGIMLTLVSGALLMLTGILFILGKIDMGELHKSLGIIAVLETLFGGLIFISQYAGDSIKSIIAITAAIALLVGALIGLSFIDPTKLGTAAASISAVMIALGALVISSNKIGSIKDIGKMYALLGVVAVLGIIVGLLSAVSPESSISSALSLSTLLLTMAGMLAILNTIKISAKDAIIGILSLTAMAIPLLALVGVLALMSSVQNATNNALALAGLATVLTLLLIPLTAIGAIVSTGIGALPIIAGILSLTAMAIPLLAFVGVLALMSGVQNATENAKLLTDLMKVMTDTLMQISIVAPLALMGVAALGGLISFMSILGILSVAIGALTSKFPAIEDFINTGIPILVGLANGVGRIIGAFVGGMITQIASGFPEIGTYLSEFMINAKPFIDGAKSIDEQVINGVGSLAKAILVLTAADIITGITSFLTGGSSIVDFGNEIGLLGPYLKAFSDSVAGVDATSIEAAANAAKALAEMTATIPNEGGVVAWFAGENSISKFAFELPILGMGLRQFSIAVEGINAENITAAANAAKALAEMTAVIPNEGGVAAWFAGENSISKFAFELPILGMGLRNFSMSVEGINIDNITAATNAAKALAEMASIIPNEGGMVAWFTGENSVSKFADQLPILGEGLKSFSDSVAEIDPQNITAASGAAKTLAEMANNTPDNTDKIITFGDHLKTFGEKLKEYFSNTNGITSESVEASISAVNAIKDLSNINTGNISSLSTSLKDIIESIKNIPNITKDVATNFNNALKELGENGTKELLKPFDNISSDFKKVGNNVLNEFVNGFEEKSDTAINACKLLVKNCADEISEGSDDFKNAGRNLVSGFANGIDSNTYLATAKARAMASAAAEAARKELDEHSPSKVFYGIGKFGGLGFVNALDDYASKAYKAGTNMASQAKNGLSRAISKVTDIINNDMDTQPTIRPILDLSDVESGVGYLSSMLSNGPSVGVMANLNSISSGMNSRAQNGVNSDVVSAIDKLRKDLGNIGGNTYNVNGITYDDGSNITEAVKEIIRAAKVERRN